MGKLKNQKKEPKVATKKKPAKKLRKPIKFEDIEQNGYTDEELDEYDRRENLENEPGFVVYGDVLLTDEEKEYLNLTPKFREHEKPNIQKWHTGN